MDRVTRKAWSYSLPSVFRPHPFPPHPPIRLKFTWYNKPAIRNDEEEELAKDHSTMESEVEFNFPSSEETITNKISMIKETALLENTQPGSLKPVTDYASHLLKVSTMREKAVSRLKDFRLLRVKS